MWNQILTQPKTTPYYSYAAKKKQELAKLSKYKLLILLISRYTHRVMRESVSHIQKVTSHEQHLFSKVWNHMNRSAYTAAKASLQKLKENVLASRTREYTIKNMTILLERMTKYKLKKTFASIVLFVQRKNHLTISNIEHMRKIIFCRKIQKLFVSKKRENLNKIKEYINFAKKVDKKVKVAVIISKNYIKHVEQNCFNRLVKNLYAKKAISSVKQQTQSKNLKQHINEMENELLTKNTSICRLEQQINQLKLEQTNNYNSFSYYSNTAYNNGNAVRNKSASKSRKGQNESMDSALDFSLGSILGNSFSLNKSRSKQMKKGDSIMSIDCNCSYKEKYVKMKNTNLSLKNQLEIVKEELDVAKDLNDHFTNQIRQYFGGQKDSIQLDRLNKEIKDIQKQRQQLRIKVTKYQHHINTLKSEFKTKIEELYRKVKKER